MPLPRPASPSPLLGRLLALSPGALVGLPLATDRPDPAVEVALTAFGPRLCTENELRHAAGSAPDRLVIDARGLGRPLLEAVLPVFRGVGAAVVVCAGDQGLLLRCCDRILLGAGASATWAPVEAVRAARCLALRVRSPALGSDTWIHFPLGDESGAEALLAATREKGVIVRESRVCYPGPLSR